jgi:hypothetical protein
MKRFVFATFLILVPVSAAFGQRGTPRFDDYAVKAIYDGKNAKPKLDKDWYMFRTRIRYAAKQKRNFAGEYVFTAWGCGAECLSPAVINVRTGNVYGVPFTVCCWQSGQQDKPVEYRLRSRLIVFRGLRNESEKDSWDDVHYYEFRNGRFRFLKTIKGS